MAIGARLVDPCRRVARIGSRQRLRSCGRAHTMIQMADEIFEARYRSWGALRRDLTEQMSIGGLLLRTGADLPQFSPVTVKVVPPSGESVELTGQVLQVMPGQGVAVQIDPDASASVVRLEAFCEGHGSDVAGAATAEDDPKITRPGEKKMGMLGPQLSQEPQELRRQLAEMTVNEKRQAAIHGRREVRLLLIKDRSKAVHPFVLQNPAVTLDEIEQIAKMPSVNPDALRMIAGNREWVRSIGVCRALVRNPKTPLREALTLLDKLPISDIRALAKSENVKTPIQRAARKKVTH